jgi:hypothetical protein
MNPSRPHCMYAEGASGRFPMPISLSPHGVRWGLGAASSLLLWFSTKTSFVVLRIFDKDPSYTMGQVFHKVYHKV